MLVGHGLCCRETRGLDDVLVGCFGPASRTLIVIWTKECVNAFSTGCFGFVIYPGDCVHVYVLYGYGCGYEVMGYAFGFDLLSDVDVGHVAWIVISIWTEIWNANGTGVFYSRNHCFVLFVFRYVDLHLAAWIPCSTVWSYSTR